MGSQIYQLQDNFRRTPKRAYGLVLFDVDLWNQNAISNHSKPDLHRLSSKLRQRQHCFE
jgi:hypothetical protein